jgi:eukaryotic-like serine/threonine-protein kinase
MSFTDGYGCAKIFITLGDFGTEGDETPPNPLAALQAELPPGELVGEFRVEKKVGEGGMATVYQAIHPQIGKQAAIKVLHPQFCTDPDEVERFMREARAVNQINHPNIVDIFSFGQLPDGRSYLIMEWLGGETLHERIQRATPPLVESTEILLSLCEALAAAHEHGIVHRDLKPENVFVTAVRGQRTRVKLLDFGIAKLTERGERKKSRTRSGMIMGTPDFISPEQARSRPLDGKSDVYSLGVMMFRLLLGQMPFDADNPMDLVQKHLTEAPPPPRSLWPEIPEALDECILHMLAKEPAQRPDLGDVQACLQEVLELLAQHPELAPPGAPAGERPKVTPDSLRRATPMSLVRPSPWRRWWAWPSFAVVLVLAVIGLVSLTPRAPTIAPPPALPPHAAIVAAPPAPAPAPPAPATGELVVQVNEPAHIELDGKVVADGAPGARLSVEAGSEHTLVVRAPGRREVQKKISVAAGAAAQVQIKLSRSSSARATSNRELVDPFGP